MAGGGSDEAAITRLGAGLSAPERLTSERELEFWRLRTKRAKGAHRLLVHGPLGSGRSTFVDAVVAAESSNYAHVVTARCPTLGELELAIRRQLADRGIDCHGDTARTVRELLAARKQLLLAVVDPPSMEFLDRCIPDEVGGLVMLGSRDGRWSHDAGLEFGMLGGDELYAVFQSARRHTLHRSAIPDRKLLPSVITLASELGQPDDAFPIDDLLDPEAAVGADEQLAMALKKPVARLETRARQLLSVLVQLGPGFVPDHLLGVGLGLDAGADVHHVVSELNDELVEARLTHPADGGARIDWATWEALGDNTLARPQRKAVQRLRDRALSLARSGTDELTPETLAAVLRLVENLAAETGSPDGELLEACAAAMADRGALRAAEAMFGTLVDHGDDGARADAQADILNDRGLVRFELGEVTAALDDFERALALFESVGDVTPMRKALVLANVGRTHARLQRHAEAAAAFERASALMRSATEDTAFHEAMVSIMLARSAAGLNDLRRARAALRHVRQSADQIADPAQASAVRHELRRVADLVGEELDDT